MNSKPQLFRYIYDGSRPYSQLGIVARLTRVLVISVRLFISGNYARAATALTFYTLFAIVPLLAVCFGIAKGFAQDDRLREMLDNYFAANQDMLNWLYRFADTTLQQARGGLIAGVGVVALFVTIIMLASNVESIFNTVWLLPPRRNIVHKVTDYLAIMVMTPILLIIAGSTTVVTKTVLNNMASDSSEIVRGGGALLAAGLEFLPLVMAWILFGFLYGFVPNTKVRFKSALLAALVGGTLFQGLQNSLIFLQVLLSKYNAIYGSFAALPLFLIWLQWSWMIALFGAELGFVHQNASTGRFEYTERKISRRLRREYLFAIVAQIIKHHETGGGALDELAVARHFQLPLYQIRDYLAELLECGVLLKTVDADGVEGFLPSLPGRELTLTKVWELLDGSGESHPDPQAEPALTEVESALSELEETAIRSEANVRLRDL